eukprot:9257120-Pyramimonas_sp.AAC.1
MGSSSKALPSLAYRRAACGGPLTESGGPLTESGGPLTESGGPLIESGGPLTESGGPLTESGGPLTRWRQANSAGGRAAGGAGPRASWRSPVGRRGAADSAPPGGPRRSVPALLHHPARPNTCKYINTM